MYDASEHPDAPSSEELQEYVLEPVSPEEIERRRDEGQVLAERTVQEIENVDAYVELNDPRMPDGTIDIGTVLYRLVQLFGTPQFPEYHAGTDISWRTDDTFKYLFRVGRYEGDPEGDPGEVTVEDVFMDGPEYLVTVHDWQTRLGVGLAEWRAERDADSFDPDPEDCVEMLALVQNVVTEPVRCEYDEEAWF